MWNEGGGRMEREWCGVGVSVRSKGGVEWRWKGGVGEMMWRRRGGESRAKEMETRNEEDGDEDVE